MCARCYHVILATLKLSRTYWIKLLPGASQCITVACFEIETLYNSIIVETFKRKLLCFLQDTITRICLLFHSVCKTSEVHAENSSWLLNCAKKQRNGIHKISASNKTRTKNSTNVHIAHSINNQ